MMCVCVCFLFVSVHSITSRNNASILSFGGGFRWQSEYSWCIIEAKSKHFPKVFKKNQEKQKKSDGKTRTFKQNQQRIDKKILDSQKNLKFNTSVHSSNFYKICHNRENLQVKKNQKVFLAHSKYKLELKIQYDIFHKSPFPFESAFWISSKREGIQVIKT
ncbi:Uncharacterized protein FWK35_00012215 [Aphis craccivora]|uniref:Secreted protein n=1 Tax=Aphis craccivora TaxID=307492 RepID=A0A6G0ZKY1_APHCR|nr:Uncharacterized protein FWK35_00012215 [Aphis craccivora]